MISGISKGQEPDISEPPAVLELLIEKINDYALEKGYVPEYVPDGDGSPAA